MIKKYDYIILPGRFQPLHVGHVKNIEKARELSENIIFAIGSAKQPRTIKNPFTANEREDMISEVCASFINDVSFIHLSDVLYNDTLWAANLSAAVNHLTANSKNVAILGFEKDESSYYLRMFPQWSFVSVDGYAKASDHVIDATKIRQLMFEDHLGYVESVVHPKTYSFLKNFSRTIEFETLMGEYKFIKKYKKSWEVAPYAPTFNTVDAVVVQSANVLLVKRKSAPGKGLWALPGGFLNQNETNAQGCVRELIEETQINVPKRTIEMIVNNCYQKCFDHPDRSLRGRTVTQAFLIELTGDKLPKVKGADDALIAKFFTFDEVRNMQEELFEDHYSIIEHMIGRVNQ